MSKHRKRKPDIGHQIYMRLYRMYESGKGRSRHADKKTGDDVKRIYSTRTYQTYRQQGKAFAAFAKKKGYTDLAAAKEIVPEYLQGMIDRNLSPYTVRTAASAIGKLYGVDYGSFGVKMPERHRNEITNNRGTSVAVSRRHVSAVTLERYGSILRCCGLRRKEALLAHGNDLICKNGQYFIDIPRGKGGKHREAIVCGSPSEVEAVVKKFRDAGNDLVWVAGIPKDIPIHRFRSEYAERIYKSVARPIEGLNGHDRYICRGDMAGVVYDRAALVYTSRQLGHNRESVVAANYLHDGI